MSTSTTTETRFPDSTEFPESTTFPDSFERDAASFRDPSGFVCHLGGDVYRAIDPSCMSLIRRLEESGLLDLLQRRGSLVRTRTVDPHEEVYHTLRRHVPEVDAFLQHERIPFLSFPYEWSQRMLADAAICCLDLQILLAEHGYSLKDATAYNVQFAKGSPVFIDVPSIEVVQRRNVWMALDQFNRMFLFPLLLHDARKCTIKEYFLSNLDGADLDDVYHRFGLLGSLRGTMWLDVLLPYHMQRLSRASGDQLRSKVTKRSTNPKPLIINLKRLRSKIDKLGSKNSRSGHWVEYVQQNTYENNEMNVKEAFVDRFLQDTRPSRVLDIGCNTGRFSELAARSGSAVVAADTDASCIDALYRRSNKEQLDILPLIVNIANPSPGVGFRNAERPSFIERASLDAVFALALVHHLLVTARLPLESIRDLLADLTTRHLIIEHVDPADEMFRTLLGAREDIYHHLNLEHFVSTFGTRFKLVARQRVTDHRTIIAFERIA